MTLESNFVATHFYDRIEISGVRFSLKYRCSCSMASDVNTYFPVRVLRYPSKGSLAFSCDDLMNHWELICNQTIQIYLVQT